MRKYRVHLHTRAGMYAQYDGHVDVLAENDTDAEDQALRQLKRTSFPDYPRDCWRVDRVETR